MKLYLAGPIAGCTDAEAHGWRERVKAGLIVWQTLDPMTRDFRDVPMTPEIARTIVEGDKADIDACDAVLAYCPHPTVGTSMEILYAYERGKPVIVVVPIGSAVSPWLLYHARAVVPTFAYALALLNGEEAL